MEFCSKVGLWPVTDGRRAGLVGAGVSAALKDCGKKPCVDRDADNNDPAPPNVVGEGLLICGRGVPTPNDGGRWFVDGNAPDDPGVAGFCVGSCDSIPNSRCPFSYASHRYSTRPLTSSSNASTSRLFRCTNSRISSSALSRAAMTICADSRASE